MTISISDEYMRQMADRSRKYCLVILQPGPRRNTEGADNIIWEHGRRNHALRVDGLLSIVCPVGNGSHIAGIGIFNAPLEEVQKIMDEDPAVQAGVLVYEAHVCRGFPGDSLPA